MSMLSAQCDELRWLAEHLEERECGMDEYVTVLRNASDTIWELRGSVHREREEADRQLMRIMSLEAALDGMHLIREQDMAENAKLRELATGLYRCSNNEGCEGCPMQDDDGWCVRDIRLRELGIEVP